MRNKILILLMFVSASCMFFSCEEKDRSGTICYDNKSHYHTAQGHWCVYYEGHYGDNFDAALDSLLQSYYQIYPSESTFVVTKDIIEMQKHPKLDTRHRKFIYVKIYESEKFCQYDDWWLSQNIIDTAGDVYRVDNMRD